MKAVIIDDEPNGREILQTLIGRSVPEIQAVWSASSAQEGIRLIMSQQPDVVFLDIEMPKANGFAVLESPKLQGMRFQVIFTTAYEQYALKAFRYAAVDYLLKPIDLDQLRVSVERVAHNHPSQTKIEEIARALSRNRSTQDKIKLVSRKGFELVEVDQIMYCKSEANYTRFCLIDGSNRLVSKTMKHYQGFLEQQGFLRIHKSHIVNLKHVTNYIQGKPGFLRMPNGKELEISKEKKKELMDYFVN